MMNLIFLAVLFFVILFAILLQVLLRCPYAVASLIAVIALIIFAFFIETLTNIFIIWIVVYTIASLLTAFLVCRFGERNEGYHHRGQRREDNGDF